MIPAPDRRAALESVLARRERARARSLPRRAASVGVGALLGITALPLLVLLPELGVPALLVALRLLADEFDWAAGAYAWVVWRWAQLRAWFHGRSRPVRALIVVALIAVAVLLVWLVVHAVS